MVNIKSGWNGLADRAKWAARGASLVAKVKATKVVWFPPKAAQTGKKTGPTTRKTAQKTATKPAKKAATTTTRAAKTTGAAKKTTKQD